MDLLIIAMALFVCAVIWWKLAETREHALEAAKHYCATVGVQFLDDSIMSNGIKFSRSQNDVVAIIRHFRFEFSTAGDIRYRGDISITGKRVLKIDLEPHKI